MASPQIQGEASYHFRAFSLESLERYAGLDLLRHRSGRSHADRGHALGTRAVRPGPSGRLLGVCLNDCYEWVALRFGGVVSIDSAPDGASRSVALDEREFHSVS